MKYIYFIIFIFLLGCQSKNIEPSYKVKLISVGYTEKLKYWQPKPYSSRNNSKVIRAKKKFVSQGKVIVIYEYFIDSSGNTQNINLLKTIPENVADTSVLMKANLIYPHWYPANTNKSLHPVKVTERLVLLPDLSIAIPPDDMDIVDFASEI